MLLDEYIRKADELGASDLHIESATPMVVRVRGELRTLTEVASPERVLKIAKTLLAGDAWAQFETRGSADLSLEVLGTRCRVNAFRTVRGIAIAVRLLAASINDLRACNLHPDLRRFTDARTGLVVISGPTGSGKSTTLAALVEQINTTRALNVITVESPLEYLFTNRRSFIRQREVPTHSPTYEQAIIDALRENPDVLVIGEMRTPEVMRLTLNAAETGHLVIATMHSATCAEALSRLCMSFPAEIQGSIRAQVADCLVGVVCQRLDYLSELGIRVPRCEILVGNSAAKGTIRVGQFSQIANVIQAGGEDGMWSFDRYQRWMAQKTDWVVQPPEKPVTSQRNNIPPPSATRSPKVSEPNVISIDEDLDLAEIARKIDEQ
jgi:twitching motility protein PilT